MTDQVVTDVLVILDPKKDLAGRGARKLKRGTITAAGQLVVNVWSDPKLLDGMYLGEIEVADGARAPYLWHRREPFLEHLERGKLHNVGQPRP
jgi:hypothetical protein